LISHIMETEKDFQVITRSCRENDDGESDPRGRITYPERFGEEALERFENVLGPYFFPTLMLNLPKRSGDMVFRKEWIKEYEILPPARSLMIYTTVDPATDPELSAGRPELLDYSVVLTCAKDMLTGKIYVLDYFRERCSPGAHAAAIFEHVLKWRPIKVGYEDVAYQKSIDYWLKELMRQKGIHFILERVDRSTRKSKDVYIMGLQPMFSAGTIYIRHFMRELVKELMDFPRGSHDDLIDALSMQLPFWRQTKVKKEEEPKLDEDPYSIEAAIRSLEERNKKPLSTSVVSSPSEYAPQNLGPLPFEMAV